MRAMRTRTDLNDERAPSRNQVVSATSSGKNRERDKSELPVDLKHPDHNVEDHREVAEDRDHSGSEHLVQRIDVGGQPRHQPADGIVIVELNRELLQMREDLLAQVVHYVLTHRLHHDGLSVLDGERGDIRDQKNNRDEDDSLIRACAKAESFSEMFDEQRKTRRRL